MVKISIVSLGALSVCLLLSGFAVAEESLAAFPAQVQLDSARDFQRLVLVWTREDGVSLDVTKLAEIRVEPDGLVEREQSAVFRPVADGAGTIQASYNGKAIVIPFTVGGASIDPPVSFRNDVEPAIMRSGCNTGACHGSARGKNGFHLSLFGYDPGADYLSLTHGVAGRRLNRASPEDSLALLKATDEISHTGGRRFREGSKIYEMLKRWLNEGLQDDPADLPVLTGIEILPPFAVMEGVETQQQFIVQARYSDGSDRDVTDLAILSSEVESTLKISARGLATAGTRGESYVMARYGSFAVVSQVIVIPEGEVVKTQPLPPANYIDELAYEKLKKLRLAAAEPASDAIFSRRVYLDVLGVLPTVEEARAFLEDADPEKRAKLIDRLLDRPEFAKVWAMKWADVLQVRTSNRLDRKGMHRYNDWLRHSISSNKPIDQLAGELLTSSGGNFTNPAANFYMVETAPTAMAENVAQVFMGIQIKCAQCHNHPFERWTMDDYYSFAAFFAQVGNKNSSDPRERIVFNKGSGEVKNLRDGRRMAPKFLGGATPDLAGRDRREVLSEWLTSPENPWFAKNIANRVWQRFFGQGIVEPVDDVRVTNPPVNAALLDELGSRLISYNFDLRKLVRDICNSNTYQMATTPAAGSSEEKKNFAYAQMRRLPAETLLDALLQVTQSKVKFAALPLGARAAQVADGHSGNYFLGVFGRPPRVTVSSRERGTAPTLAQALHLINGETVNSAIRDANGRVVKSIQSEMATEALVEELYLAAYARRPSEEEQATFGRYVDEAEDRRLAVEDLYWTVLNSKEFIFNH